MLMKYLHDIHHYVLVWPPVLQGGKKIGQRQSNFLPRERKAAGPLPSALAREPAFAMVERPQSTDRGRLCSESARAMPPP